MERGKNIYRVDPDECNAKEYGEEYPACPNIGVETIEEVDGQDRSKDHCLMDI